MLINFTSLLAQIDELLNLDQKWIYPTCYHASTRIDSLLHRLSLLSYWFEGFARTLCVGRFGSQMASRSVARVCCTCILLGSVGTRTVKSGDACHLLRDLNACVAIWFCVTTWRRSVEVVGPCQTWCNSWLVHLRIPQVLLHYHVSAWFSSARCCSGLASGNGSAALRWLEHLLANLHLHWQGDNIWRQNVTIWFDVFLIFLIKAWCSRCVGTRNRLESGLWRLWASVWADLLQNLLESLCARLLGARHHLDQDFFGVLQSLK